MPQIPVASPSETMVIRAKDLVNIFGYTERTAFRYLRDIKSQYGLKTVLCLHVKMYFHIP